MQASKQRDSIRIPILTRLIRPNGQVLSAPAARSLLRLRFDDADKKRMHKLAAKAREGRLTAGEETEIELYGLIGNFLGILHSKARRSLKQHDSDARLHEKAS